MTEETKDIFGQVFWYAIPFTPVITIPLMWLNNDLGKPARIIIGLILALILSVLFYFIAIGICFRHGMGPS